MNNEMFLAALANVRKVEQICRKINAETFCLSARETANNQRKAWNHCRRQSERSESLSLTQMWILCLAHPASFGKHKSFYAPFNRQNVAAVSATSNVNSLRNVAQTGDKIRFLVKRENSSLRYKILYRHRLKMERLTLPSTRSRQSFSIRNQSKVIKSLATK